MSNEMTQVFFDEYHVAPEQTVEASSRTPPRRRVLADRVTDTLATTCVIAMLECLCNRELQRHLKPDIETAVATQMHCTQCAPIPVGSRLRMTGWIERLGDRNVTFRVKAQDEQEQVCDGQIQFAIVRRAEMDRLVSRKHEAIARREMFAPA
jgi:fluoroacetyl-CoA thioesterase